MSRKGLEGPENGLQSVMFHRQLLLTHAPRGRPHPPGAAALRMGRARGPRRRGPPVRTVARGGRRDDRRTQGRRRARDGRLRAARVSLRTAPRPAVPPAEDARAARALARRPPRPCSRARGAARAGAPPPRGVARRGPRALRRIRGRGARGGVTALRRMLESSLGSPRGRSGEARRLLTSVARTCPRHAGGERSRLGHIAARGRVPIGPAPW